MLVEVAVTATTQAQHVSAYITNYLSTLVKSYLSISYRWTVVVIYLSLFGTIVINTRPAGGYVK